MNKKKLFICFFAFFWILGVAGNTSQSAKAENAKKIIVAIDAGHQAKGNSKKEPIGPGAKKKKAKVTSGTQGIATKVSESKLNLAIAKKLKKKLEKRGYGVYMIRTKQKVNISNKQRALKANKSGASIYIRLHADAAGSSIKGASALYPSKKNKYVKKLSAKSKKLSKCVLNSYCKKTKFKNRGLYKRDDLTGTNWSKIPVTLIEMGFMTNRKEDKKMQKSSYQDKMATGIADGVNQYFGK
ncbi:MAG: N-acetylmuramoyl-L-alanine amidase [Anaerostipes sp.]|nr:N-acetylmuramoyl-L-alanine amidase [Anaerostipes sp.]